MANAWVLKPLPLSTVAASSTATGDPTYLGNDYAGVIWKSALLTSLTLLVDLGADTPVDTLFLFGVKAPTTGTVGVKGATSAQGSGFGAGAFTDGGSVSIFAGTNRLTSGAGVTLWSAPGGWPAAVRYLQLTLANSSASTFQVSRIAVGARIALSRNFVFGGAIGVRDLGSLDFSRRGVLMRARGAKLRTASLTFSNVLKSEVEAAVEPLIEQVGNTEPVAIITDPSADPMRERRCFFGQLVGDLGNTWRNAAAWEWKANVVSLF